ncbi:MAG: peptidoglycan DD-metalloendopeptidase family protein, partial [Clostridium celatum]|nr:peptidoglycan DD-metalloendopeptidase family protein [Clostridium celatum]
EINILGEIEDLPCSLNIIDLKQNKEIAREIYEATLINENLLDLQIKVNVVEREEVDEDVVIKQDDSLYIGQNEAIKGEKGECLLYKEITYDGLVKSNEKVVRERLIKSPVDTVIKKGTKNPYYDGVSFLYRPTSGGYMTSIFGEERVNSYHKGIDIAKDMGEDVIAAFDGEIKSAGYNDGGYGNLIIIEHEGNMETYYAHLSEIYVSEGDIVKKGDIIGAIGSTGYSTGPHLHFELRVNGEPVNPEPYIE